MTQRLGWTLLHFLWQGTAIAAMYALFRAALTRVMDAQGRYVLGCAALLAIAITPVITFLLIPDSGTSRTTVWALSDIAWQRFLPVVVVVWLAGVLAFSIRLFSAWRFTARLRSTSHPAPIEWQQCIKRIGERLGSSRTVRLLISSLVDVPTVVGWLRPAILLPISSLTGMPPEHITALLGHEAAHIRRNDYLVNILQSIVEAVLFYHPAVWWISDQIRSERELCCDDLAASVCGDVLVYAHALARLESLQTPHRSPVLTANGGSLVNRIRRLIEPANSRANDLPAPGAAWAMTLLWFAGVGVTAVPAAQTPRPAPPAPAQAANHNPSPFLVPVTEAPPVIALAAHARRTLLVDPFLPQLQAANNDDLSAPWRGWLNQDVTYIITSAERKAFLQLSTDEERVQFVEQFWLLRDPTPATLQNEFKEEHYRRIEYANRHFSSRIPGWKTDRGRVYITYGTPDAIDSRGSVEDWRYRFIEGIGNNALIEFTDPAGTGDFRIAPGALPELLAANVPALPPNAGRNPFVPDSLIDDAALADGKVLPMRVQVDYLRVTGSSTMTNITAGFENSGLQFRPTGGVQKASINLFGRITTMNRRPVTTFEKPIEISALQVPTGQSLYQQALPLAPGRYRLIVVGKDTGSGNLNRYEVSLDVPAFDDSKLASSSLILADTLEKTPARTIGPTFAVGDMKVRPRPGNTFTSNEKLGIYLEFYNFTPDPVTQRPSGSIEYEIDKAVSNEKILTFSEDLSQMATVSASQVSVEKMTPLSTLAPGSYTLKVTAIDHNGNRTLQRSGAFIVTVP